MWNSASRQKQPLGEQNSLEGLRVTFFILILFVCFCDGERWGKTARLVSPTERLWSFYAKAVGLGMGFYTLRVLKGDQATPAEEEENSGESQPELTHQEITVFLHC